MWENKFLSYYILGFVVSGLVYFIIEIMWFMRDIKFERGIGSFLYLYNIIVEKFDF